MNLRAYCLLGFCVVWSGCFRPGGEHVVSPAAAAKALEPEPAAPAAPVPRPPASPIDFHHALIVGDDDGLLLWTVDGSAHHMLSEGAAFYPRRIGADAVLVLSGELSNLHIGAQLVRISLIDGSRTALATLPPYACANATDDDSQMLGLDIQDPHDFVVDPDGKRAYLSMMDRNSNMASLQVKIRVELDSGRVMRWQTVGEPECLPPPGVELGYPPDEQWPDLDMSPDDEPASASYAFDFDADSGWVKTASEPATKHLRLRDYSRECTSPSGRWLVLGGDLQEADYVHRSLVLLDREAGAVFPVLEAPGAWPLPLTAAKRTVKTPVSGMADVVGESDVRWLRFADGAELLIVDQLVLQPNKPSWTFEGELVR
jgi:hypothetical protein